MDVVSKILDSIFSSIDLVYMLAVNISTYLVIKLIDELNGEKAVPVYAKRVITLVTGAAIGVIVYALGGNAITIFYSFILSIVSWDVVFKPILHKFKNLDYKGNRDKPLE